jgi:cell division transport system ATP-binding protein
LPLLHGLDFTLARGERLGIVGESGSAKSIAMHAIAGLLPEQLVSSGSIRFDGQELVGLSDREHAALRGRRIGMVFQDFRLIDHMTAFDNVALPLRIGGAPEEEVASFVQEMLAWLGVAELMDQRPPALSMGQRRLLAVARAVVTRPSLLLADEPTSNVDPANAERLMHLFVELHRLGTAVVLATHNTEMLRRYAYPRLRMQAGRLLSPPMAVSGAYVDRRVG